DGWSNEGPWVAMSLGGIAGMAAGGIIGNATNPRPSSAFLSNMGAVWGTWYGLSGGILLGLEGDGLLASTLLMGDVGLLVMAVASPSIDWTTGRSRLVQVAGAAGIIVGFGIDLMVLGDFPSQKAVFGIPAVASIAGLVLGVATTEDSQVRSAGPTDDGSMALLQVTNGKMAFRMPTVLPAVIKDETGERRVGLQVPLFNAIF
ncbi:MAG: hypothetical protein OEZ54_11030, partial [Gemmatimonadota bacterium]|nr:hypothetical protein [Gemmatimonadota bacterium]